jgi:hypothetical protein
VDAQKRVPVRLIAVGAVLILVAAAAAILIPRGKASGAPSTTPALTRTTATTTTANTTTTATTAKPTTVKQQPRPGGKKSAKRALIVGVAAIERALRTSPVVVVAAVQPLPVVDRQTAREAKAGAQTAGVPYVELDVLDEKQARQLFTLLEQNGTSATGTLPSTPQTMIFQRPRKVVLSFGGYIDREIVAQAAAAAAGRPGGEAWQMQANAICTKNEQRLSLLPMYGEFKGSKADFDTLRKAIGMIKSMISDLSAVHPPASKAARFQEVLAQTREFLTQIEKLFAAYQKGQGPELVSAYLRLDTLEADVNAGFIELGLTSCI